MAELEEALKAGTLPHLSAVIADWKADGDYADISLHDFIQLRGRVVPFATALSASGKPPLTRPDGPASSSSSLPYRPAANPGLGTPGEQDGPAWLRVISQ